MAEEQPDNTPADRSKPPSVDRVLTSVRHRLGGRDAQGRPFSVYAVLAIGVATLLILLLVVYFSAADRDRADQPICTTIQPEQAELAVRDGTARRLTIAYDDEVEIPTNRRWGPVLARLDYANGQCANLPQGIANQGDVYTIVGVIEVYNETTENPRVEIIYERSGTLDEGLFAMPSPTASPTLAPTVTPSPTPGPTLEPSPDPTLGPTPGSTVTPAPPATESVVIPPIGPPVAPPAVAPTASPDPGSFSPGPPGPPEMTPPAEAPDATPDR